MRLLQRMATIAQYSSLEKAPQIYGIPDHKQQTIFSPQQYNYLNDTECHGEKMFWYDWKIISIYVCNFTCLNYKWKSFQRGKPQGALEEKENTIRLKGCPKVWKELWSGQETSSSPWHWIDEPRNTLEWHMNIKVHLTQFLHICV